MTNGGKSTLSQSLHQQIPNSCVIAQDSYFKVEVFLFRKSCQGFLAHMLKNVKLYLFTRMSQRCQRTAMDLSNMIVRVEKSILKPYITAKYFSVVKQDSHSRVLFECWTRFTWTRWWAILIHGEEIHSGSWGRGLWSLLMNSCLCWSWKVSSFSTTGFPKLLIVPNLSNLITSLWLCVSPLHKRILNRMDH